MLKIGRFYRQKIEQKIKTDIEKSSALFVLNYSGLSSAQMTLLRMRVKEIDSQIIVAKNSLCLRVFKEKKIDGISAAFNGPTALVFSYQDIGILSKALINFTKDNPALGINSAFFNNRVLSKDDIENIAKLPSKHELQAQVVMLIASPLANLLFTLKGNLNKLAVVLQQIKEKKNGG